MDLGSEISKNFKDSIKQKLKECGTYIDDELPEYIMVMIANKRHENQMKEDLSLFLGDETDNFVRWLFQMLTDLQNVAQDKLKASQSERTKLQVIETNEARNEAPKNKEQSRRDAVSTEINELTILTRQISDETEEKINSKDTFGADILEIESDYDIERKNSIGKKKRDSTEGRKRKIQEDPSKRIDKSNKVELLSRDQSKRSRPSWSSTPKQKEDNANDKTEELDAPRKIASSVVVQKIRPSLPRPHQPPGSLIMRAINEANLSVAMKPRRSQDQIEVGAGRPDDAAERKIKLKRSRSSLQGETAVERDADEIGEKENDSKELETSSKRKLLGDQEKTQDDDDDIELEVGENEFVEEGNEVTHRASTRIVISHRGIEDDSSHIDKEASHEIQDNEKENLERGRKNDQSIDNCYGRDARGERRNEEEDDERTHSNRRKRKHKRERSNHRERRYSNPKFIVTLHGGLDERVKEERLQQRDVERDPLFINLNPKGPMAVLESAQNEINRMARQLDLIQNIVPYSDSSMSTLSSQSTTLAPPGSGIISSITRPIFQEALPLMSVSNGFVQNDFAAQQNRMTSLLQTPLPVTVAQTASGNTESPKARSQSREIIVPLEIENGSENDESEVETANRLKIEKYQETVLERCKFWPSCKNPSCPYVHPSKTCRMFPNCNFKDKCIFMHPMCKFDQRCINSECPYTHTSNQKRDFVNFESKAIPPFMKTSVNTPLCKFIPNCSKSNCPFRHPVAKPCRYGSGCKRPNCQFHHETKPATGDALKWTNASSSNIQKHISERKFAVKDKDVTEVPVEIRSKAN